MSSKPTHSSIHLLESRLAELDRFNLPSHDLVDVLNELTRQLSDTDPARARAYNKRALACASDMRYAKGEIRSLVWLAWSHFVEGKPDLALSRAINAQMLAQRTAETVLEGHSLYVIAAVYDQVGNGKEALKYHHKLLAIAYETNDNSLQANTWLALGGHHLSQQNNKQAFDCYARAFELAQTLADDRVVWALNNMACALLNMGDVLAAEQRIVAALAECDPQNSRAACEILHTFGNVLAAQGRMEDAELYYQRALRMNPYNQDGEKNVEVEVRVHLDLAKVQQALQQDTAAHESLTTALNLAQTAQNPTLLLDVTAQLAEFHKAKGEFALALAYAEHREAIRTNLHLKQSDQLAQVINVSTIIGAMRHQIHLDRCHAVQEQLWNACLDSTVPLC